MTLKDILVKSVKWLWNTTLNSSSQWIEVYVSPGNRPEPTMRRFAYLRARGIRCRLHHFGTFALRTVIVSSISLRVYKDDLVKARQLMSEVQD